MEVYRNGFNTSKSKVSTFSTDSFSFGTMMIILCVVMIGSHIVDEYVHSNFSIPAILFLVSIVVLSFISQ